MTYSRVFVGAMMAMSFATGSMAASKEPTLRDKQQAACATDVKKLCPDAMMDEAKATECMKSKRAEVSPECAKMYDVKQ